RIANLLRPDVLPDEQRGGGVRLELLRGGLEVFLVQQPAVHAAELRERRADIGVEIARLERGHVAVRILDHECEIDDVDRPVINQLLQRRDDLTLELVPGERHDHVLHGTNAHPLLLRKGTGAQCLTVRRSSHHRAWPVAWAAPPEVRPFPRRPHPGRSRDRRAPSKAGCTASPQGPPWCLVVPRAGNAHFGYY